MSLGGNRADAKQPGFNNRLDGENTADGPRPEMTVERRPGPAPPEELPPDHSALPRVDERRDKKPGVSSTTAAAVSWLPVRIARC